MNNLLVKISKIVENSIDKKLYNCKTKQSAIKYIYNQVNHLIKGFFRDDNWENVMKIFNTISKLGVDLKWEVKDGGYHDVRNTSGDIISQYKKYDFTIQFININNKEIKIIGQIIATGAGSVDDIFEKYDIALILS